MKIKTLKEISASRLQFLQKVDADLVQGKETAGSVIEYLYATTKSIPELIKATKSKDAWEMATMTFGDKLDLADFQEYQEFMEADFKRINSASVEPTEKDGGGKD